MSSSGNIDSPRSGDDVVPEEPAEVSRRPQVDHSAQHLRERKLDLGHAQETRDTTRIEHHRRQSIEPGATTHSTGWPVTDAM